jgi:hypothetical protein
MADYGDRRKDMRYYREAANYVRRFVPVGQPILDVGGGVLLGCRFLESLPEYDRTSIELPRKSTHTIEGVRVLEEDFMQWKADQEYSAVLCLQVLEHVERPKEFALKLFSCAPVVILSVPYRWSAGFCECHKHDPVDEKKLKGWTGIDPTSSVIVSDDKKRMVSAYVTRGGLR